MIVRCFPHPIEQSRALAIFGGFGAIGNVVGFILVRLLASPFSFLILTIVARREVSLPRDLIGDGVSLTYPSTRYTTILFFQSSFLSRCYDRRAIFCIVFLCPSQTCNE